MAVYTQLEFDEIQTLVAQLKLGRLLDAQGVAAGVENTTYFLDFAPDREGESVQQYVLTIAETLSQQDLEFIAKLMRDLNSRGLPVPTPAGNGKSVVLQIRGKPALAVPKITGVHPQFISADLCQHVGTVLAQLHVAALALGGDHESHRSLAWVETTGKALLPHLTSEDKELLNHELAELNEFVSAHNTLPQGIIHGDLFRDNVLIQNEAIVGIIDFFSAGTGYLLFDTAVAVNDWCFDARGNFNFNNYKRLIEGYCHVRAPQIDEIERWSQLLQIAALRFWVSRLSEKLIAGPHAPSGRGKDPVPYRQLLLYHRTSPLRWIP